MEQWEMDLRAELHEELEDGAYNISFDGFVMYTGKLGYINHLVHIERWKRDFISGIEKMAENHIQNNDTGPNIKDYLDVIKNIEKGK